MRTSIIYITGALWLSIAGCTSLSEGQQNLPTGVVTDHRVRYRGDVSLDLRERMNEQASEINRKRNIEQFDRNEPAMTPPDLRPQLVPLAPVDSTLHNIHRPVRPVRPIQIDQ